MTKLIENPFGDYHGKMDATDMKMPYIHHLPVIVLIVLFTIIILQRGWIGDDAYITFRTIDNFVNMHTLSWNITERVQAFTHPLWLFLLTVFYMFTHELFYSTIFISVAISTITLIILSKCVASNELTALFGVLLCLLSNAFVDYSTSGLENPLTHLLLIIFFAVYFRPYFSNKTLILSFIMCLGLLNRIDSIFLYIPAMIYAIFETPLSVEVPTREIESQSSSGRYSFFTSRFMEKLRNLWNSIRFSNIKPYIFPVFVGQIPLFLWEIFSLFYYGFPFPNTAYAKLNTGVPRNELIVQGYIYLLDSLQFDMSTLLVIIVAIIVALISRERQLVVLAMGVLLYMGYVVSIGGDFMRGRFLTAPFLLAVVLITRVNFSSLHKLHLQLLFGIILLIAINSPNSTFLISHVDLRNTSDQFIEETGVADERLSYTSSAGLIMTRRDIRLPNTDTREKGLRAAPKGQSITLRGAIGVFGFYAGPEIHIFDHNALTDPLLARLPTEYNIQWRIGHFSRTIPEGYLETLGSGKNQLADPDLAQYYEKLSLIIRGNLLDPQRLVEIWNMNTGKYDSLIDFDRYRYPDMLNLTVEQLSGVKKAGIAWNNPRNLIMTDSGVEILLDEVSHSSSLEISLDNNDDYKIIFLLGDLEIKAQTIFASYYPEDGLAIYSVSIPSDVSEKGFDVIRVLPIRGDDQFSIGHLILGK